MDLRKKSTITKLKKLVGFFSSLVPNIGVFVLIFLAKKLHLTLRMMFITLT